MKIKSILSLLLVVILCLSCAVACSRKKEEEKTEAPKGSASEKAVIVKAINGFTIGGLMEDLEGTSMSYTDYMSMIKDVNGSVSADLKAFDENYSFSAFMNNGLMSLKYNDNEVYSIYKDDGGMIGFTSDYRGDGYMVTVISAEDIQQTPAGSMMNPGDMDAMLEEYLGMLGLDDSMMETVKNFKLPKITEDDLTLKNGYYVISSSCYSKVADSVIALVEDMMGQEFEDEETAYVDQIVDAVKAAGLEIGFAVTGENITGFKLAVDCDLAEVGAIFASETTGNVAASFEIKLTSDAKRIDSVKLSVDANVGDDLAAAGFSSLSGSASIGFIYNSENQPAGLSVAIEGTVKDTKIEADSFEMSDYGDDEYYEDDYAFIYAIGDATVKANVTVDFTKLDSTGAKVVDAEASFKYDAKSLTCDEDVDLSEYNANDYDQNGSVKASATSKGNKKAEFSVSVEYNGTQIVNLASGTLDLAISGTTVPAIVVAAQSDSFEDAYKNLENIGEAMEELAADSYENYCYYDAATGLYVYTSKHVYSEIGTVAPADYFYGESYNNYNG